MNEIRDKIRIIRHGRGLTALTTSILMILLGQANAWYANQPEDNIVKDIKRKLKIAVLLLIPNAATLGSGLMIALTIVSHKDSIRSWNAWALGIGLIVSLCSFCVYWACICCPLPFCSIQTRGMKLHFFIIYPKIPNLYSSSKIFLQCSIYFKHGQIVLSLLNHNWLHNYPNWCTLHKQTNNFIIISGKTTLHLVLTTCYCALLAIVIWTIVDVSNFKTSKYRQSHFI